MNTLRILILPLLMLLNINNLFQSNNVIWLMQLMLIVIVAYFLWRNNKFRIELSGSNIIVIISIIAAIRGFIGESIDIAELLYTVFVLMALAIIASSIATADQFEDKISIWFSLSISSYVAICVILYIIGVRQSVDVYTFDNASRMGSWLGIDQRIHFPFTAGINSFGSIVGLSIVSTTACIIFAPKYRPILVLLLLFSILAIIGVDSRGPLLYSIAAFPLGYMACNNFRAFAYLSLLLAVMFFLVVLNLNLFLEYAADLIDILTGRPLIWFTAVTSLNDFEFNHLLGFGMYGQVLSEISFDYAKLFSSFDTDNPERMSLHNFALQSIFDIGVAGYLTIMAITFSRLYQFSKCRCNKCKMYSFIIMYLLLCGMTEPVPTVYSLSTFLVFLIATSFKHPSTGTDLHADSSMTL